MKALIVIDMQNDFISGALGTPEAQAIVPNVVEKIKQRRAEGYEITFTLDTHYDDYLNTFEGRCLPIIHCQYMDNGWLLDEKIQEVHEAVTDNCIYKSSYGDTKWNKFFDEDPEVIELCGLVSDICVISNALILRSYYPESKIVVDSKCCAGLTPEKHVAALDVMASCNIEILA